MIVGQVVMERTNSLTFCWRSTNKGSFSTDMYGCVFHLFSVWYSFWNIFLPKPPADHLANRRGSPVVRGPHFDLFKTLRTWLSLIFIHSQALIVRDGHLASLFGVSWSHTYRHTVGLLWTSDQPVAEASTYVWQNKDKRPCPERYSNPIFL